MVDESATSDLAELTRTGVEAVNRRDFDAVTSFYASDAVLTLTGMGTSYEGVAAIRGFLEDFAATFAEYEIDLEEFIDLGGGVTFSVFHQQARPLGSSGRVEMRFAGVGVLADGLLVRNTWYINIDAARTAAERLARERG